MSQNSDEAPVTAPYGTWTSPITAETLSTEGLSLLDLGVHVRNQPYG